MLRPAPVVVAVLMALGIGNRAVAVPPSYQQILLAGSDQLAIIDANDNGILGEDDDCVVHARTDGSHLDVFGRQSSSASNRMALCSNPSDLSSNEGHCWGTGSVSSSADVLLNTCDFAGAPFVPFEADFCTSMASCNSDTAPSAATTNQDGSGPLKITAGVVFQTTFITPFESGSGQVCSAGGPTAQITGDDGVTVLRQLVTVQDGSNSYMCAHNVPVELLGGGFVFKTACFPVRNGGADFALENTPDTPFVVIDFSSLPGCGRLTGAPTMTEWGLITLMLALLAFGTWTLGRRPGFSALRLP